MSADSSRALLGLFVGGRGQRMGGVFKALLVAPGGAETLAARSLRIAREVGLDVVIVGAVGAADLPPSAAALPRLADAPAGVGPLGGLGALLTHAAARPALALACDMPYVSAALLAKLAHTPAAGAVLAPRDRATGKWQPLFARYDPPQVRAALEAALAAGERSFQALFARLSASELPLTEAEHAELRDWDHPHDIER
jgi:molybdopterin-guanine dinucleotide biosynthesis protein A